MQIEDIESGNKEYELTLNLTGDLMPVLAYDGNDLSLRYSASKVVVSKFLITASREDSVQLSPVDFNSVPVWVTKEEFIKMLEARKKSLDALNMDLIAPSLNELYTSRFTKTVKAE